MKMDHPRVRAGTPRTLAALAALLLAAGCGMYGDLYVEEAGPQAPPEVEERPPIAAESVAPSGAPARAEPAETEEDPAKPRGTPPDGAGDDAAGRP